MKFTTKTLLSLATCLLLTACATAAPYHDRVLLGERVVNDRTETDTIIVGKRKGSFKGLQIKAIKAPIEIKKVTIVFANGSKVRFDENALLRAGELSRVLNLPGDDRLISKVVLTYEARSPGYERAVIRLFGIG